MERWGVLDEPSTHEPVAFGYGNAKLSFCLGHEPRTERARANSSFPHDALLVLSFTVPVLRQEITYHRASQASFRAEYSVDCIFVAILILLYRG